MSQLIKLVKLFLGAIFLFCQTTSPFLPPQTCVVSLGSNCRVATWLRALTIRYKAFPFDWVETEDIVGLTELLKNDFKDYIRLENLIPAHNYFYNRVMDNVYKIHFVHDFSFQGNAQFSFAHRSDYLHGISCLNREYKQFYSKYARRIQRFRELGSHYKQIIFVRTLLVDRATAQELYQALLQLFEGAKDQITLLVISDTQDFIQDWNLPGIKNFYLATKSLTTDGDEALFKDIVLKVLYEK